MTTLFTQVDLWRTYYIVLQFLKETKKKEKKILTKDFGCNE